MRVAMLACSVAVAMSTVPAGAQVYRNETPPPQVTAAGAAWQSNGEPVFHAGNLYYPAGATVYFDGKVMVQTGVYAGVPLYADVTLEPYSIVYVPVGGALMRPYERRREGELAGTVGSRTPSFPIARDTEVRATAGAVLPPVSELDAEIGSEPGDLGVPVGTLGQMEALPVPVDTFTPAGVVMVSPGSAGAAMPSPEFGNRTSPPAGLPAAGDQSGVWIDYEGARWFSAGTSVAYDPARFEPAGSYRGFPVYRERGTTAVRIFVAILTDGPIAPFERR